MCLLLASNGYRLGTLLHTLPSIGEPSKMKNYPAQIFNSAKVEKRSIGSTASDTIMFV